MCKIVKEDKGIRLWGFGERENKIRIYLFIYFATKSKNQNYVPNMIYLFIFLNCDFNCETKTMYQI